MFGSINSRSFAEEGTSPQSKKTNGKDLGLKAVSAYL